MTTLDVEMKTNVEMFNCISEILDNKQTCINFNLDTLDDYLEFIEKHKNNNNLKKKYQTFTEIYDKKDFDWMYNFVYILLFLDFSCVNEEDVDRNLYEDIMNNLILIKERNNISYIKI